MQATLELGDANIIILNGGYKNNEGYKYAIPYSEFIEEKAEADAEVDEVVAEADAEADATQ